MRSQSFDTAFATHGFVRKSVVFFGLCLLSQSGCDFGGGLDLHDDPDLSMAAVERETRPLPKRFTIPDYIPQPAPGTLIRPAPLPTGVHGSNSPEEQLQAVIVEQDGTIPIQRVLVGGDDRTRVRSTSEEPFKRIALITMLFDYEWYLCTGAMIRNSLVLTAAHCLYNPELGGYADYVIVVPGAAGILEPFGKSHVIESFVFDEWAYQTDYNYDIGIARVADPIGEMTGTFGYAVSTDQEIEALGILNTAGYPGDKDNQQMWKADGPISAIFDAIICHECDTHQGQSGSPVFTYNQETGEYQIRAVHSGSGGECYPNNRATRITPEKFEWINEHMAKCTCSTGACCDGCKPRSNDYVCRESTGECDVAEKCTGTGIDCPADVLLPPTLECRPSEGVCDIAEYCTGVDGLCPNDAFLTSTHECRAAAGDCDVPEFCNGYKASCPQDSIRPKNHICRAAAHQCDVPERCNGTSMECPVDSLMDPEVACDDEDPLTIDDKCTEAGECIGTVPPPTGCSADKGHRSPSETGLMLVLFLLAMSACRATAGKRRNHSKALWSR